MINLFRGYYLSGISSELSANASCIFQALLYKANELRYPQSFTLSNMELCGLASSLSYNAMWQARELLAEYKRNGEAIIKIAKGDSKKNKSATYEINYDLIQSAIIAQLSDNHQTINKQPIDNQDTTLKQCDDNQQTSMGEPKSNNDCAIIVESEKSGYILREDKIDKNRVEENRKDNNDPRDDDENDNPQYSDDEIAIIALLNKKYATTWDGGMGTKYYPTLKEIATYPYQEIVEAVNATHAGCKERPPRMLSYLLTVLKNLQKEVRERPQYYEKLGCSDEQQLVDDKDSAAKEKLRKMLAENISFADMAKEMGGASGE